MFLSCQIKDIAYYLPEKIIFNQADNGSAGKSGKNLSEKLGISQIHIAGKNEHVSDLALKAAQKLLEQNNLLSKGIQALILCTQTPDRALPGSAFLIHEKLGLPQNCLVFDYNHGCTGFIYGLALAGSLIHSGMINNALLIMAETYSKWCHPQDKSVNLIFGDGAAAIYLTRSEDENMGPFIFGSDGKGYSQLTVPVSGSYSFESSPLLMVKHKDRNGNIRRADNLYMNGPEVYRFAMATVPALVKEIQQKNKRPIDKYIFHQANRYMLKSLQEKIGICDEKMVYDLEDVGNTVSVSIPLALKRAYERNQIHWGETLMLIGFGVGYSWGGTVLTWKPEKKN